MISCPKPTSSCELGESVSRQEHKATWKKKIKDQHEGRRGYFIRRTSLKI